MKRGCPWIFGDATDDIIQRGLFYTAHCCQLIYCYMALITQKNVFVV